jgi:hypothetical protein
MNPDATPNVSPNVTSLLMNVLVAPGEAFTQLRAAPVRHANWIVPAVIFVVASWLVAGLMFSSSNIQNELRTIQHEAMQKQFQKFIDQGKMTQAEVDQMVAQTERYTTMGQAIGGVLGAAISAVVLPFWGGFILWAGSHIMMRRPIDFMKGVEAAGLIMVITALGALAKGLLCVAKGTLFTGFGAVLLLPHYDPTNHLHNAVASIEIFALWALAVKCVSLAKLCEGSLLKATTWVAGLWLVLTAGQFGFAYGVQKILQLVQNLH